MDRNRLLASVSAIALLLGLLYFFLHRDSLVASDSKLPDMVFVDKLTGKPYVLNAGTIGQTNPETGQATLIPALYCEKCQLWRPIGTLEQLQRSPKSRNCPVHKIAMLQDGPFPEKLSK